ncbi:MAG TPA: VTT domain-containing protein [Myxococcota bacterium]|nr:VTT domain-containing protein [Myxococcota bacterium]
MTRVLLLLLVVVALAAAWASGLYAHATPERVADLVAGAGALGPLAFIALFAAAETVHVPGVLFVLAASALWPPAVAIPTAYAGALTASLAVFFLARRIVPAGARERLPEWLLRYESRLETHGLQTVIALRLVLFLLPTVHWLLGASRVSFRDYLLGSAIGLLPGVVFYVLVGRQALEHWPVVRPWALGAATLLAALLVARGVRSLRARPSP